jgi:hypothetical protein
MIKMTWLLAGIALFAIPALAADVSGTWKASTETQNGTFETTFVFKVDGEKLTGTTSNQFSGDTPISEGKIDGDNLSFTVAANFNGNEFKLNYKGKVAGNEMKLTVSIPQRERTFEMTAKKVS